MSQTNSAHWQYTSPTPFPFDQWTWDFEAGQTQQIILQTTLTTILQGVFTTLCASSMYALIRRDGKVRTPSVVLALALLALFTSTTKRCCRFLRAKPARFRERNRCSRITALLKSVRGLLRYRSTSYLGTRSSAGGPVSSGKVITLSGGSAPYSCWRPSVSSRHRLTTLECLTRTHDLGVGLGLVDIKHACTPEIGGITSVRDTGAGFLYAGFSHGIAATALSFCTNFWATALVGYKALVSRRFVRKHVIAGSLRLQTESVLSLLLESGAFYCAIWAFVVARQIGEYAAIADDNLTPTSSWVVCGVVIAGALVPIIAIYPTIIIILVALNRSQIEHGFGREDEPGGPGPACMPPRTPTVTIRSAAEVQADVHQAETRSVDIAHSKRARAESESTVTDGPSTEELTSSRAPSSSSAFVAV